MATPPAGGRTAPDVLSEADALDRPDAGRMALRGGTVRTAGYVAGMALAVATVPLLIRHLGVADFGRFVSVLSLVALVGGFSELGINQLALREYAAGTKASRARALPLLLGLRLTSGALVIVVATAFAAIAGYGGELVVGTAFAAVALVVGGAATLLSTSLQGDLRLGTLTAVEVARHGVVAAAVVVLVLAGAGVPAFLAVQVPIAFAALALTAWLVRGRMPLRPRFDLRGSKALLADTAAYAVATALHIAYFRIAMVVTSLLATRLETGYFATSFRITEVLIALPSLLVGAAFPILARTAEGDSERFDAAMRRILELSLLAGLWVALVTALAAPQVVELLTGERAQPAVDALRLQSLALVPAFLAYAMGYALLALRRYRGLLLAVSAAAIGGLATSVALVPGLGADGAALASIAAELGLAGVYAWQLRGARPGSTGMTGNVAAVLAAAAGAAAGLLSGLPGLAAAALGTVVFAAALAALGRFPPEVHALLPSGRR